MQLMLVRPNGGPAMNSTRHLSAVETAAFVDGTLTRGERETVELHLSECETCRTEVAECARISAEAPRQAIGRRSWMWVGALAAAILLLVVLPGTRRIASDPAHERGSDRPNAVVILSPLANAAIGRADLRFVWRADERSAGYRVFVKDSTGTTLWTTEVAGTAVAPPLTVTLRVGTKYFWRVDALRKDGTVGQSAETAFEIAPH